MVVFFSTQDLVEFHHQVFSKCLEKEADEGVDIEAGGKKKEESDWLFKLHGDMQQKVVYKLFTLSFSKVSEFSNVFRCNLIQCYCNVE